MPVHDVPLVAAAKLVGQSPAAASAVVLHPDTGIERWQIFGPCPVYEQIPRTVSRAVDGDAQTVTRRESYDRLIVSARCSESATSRQHSAQVGIPNEVATIAHGINRGSPGKVLLGYRHGAKMPDRSSHIATTAVVVARQARGQGLTAGFSRALGKPGHRDFQQCSLTR